MAQTNTQKLFITEIFPDPTPSLGLPEKEFVEIANNGSQNELFTNIQLCDRDKCYTLPDFSLESKSALLICKSSDVSHFTSYGQVLGISSFPSLNNDGDHLYLKKFTEEIIDSVQYTSKEVVGGITLERSHLENTCIGSPNFWMLKSNENIGSLGKLRPSQIEQSTPITRFSNIYAPNDSTLSVQFTNSVPAPIKDINLKIDDVPRWVSPSQTWTVDRELQIKLQPKLNQGFSYQIAIQNQSDCYGKSIPDTLFNVIVPNFGNQAKILINELLFNPKTGGVDFIEIINYSDHEIYDLNQYQLANFQQADSSFKKLNLGKSFYLFPNQAVAITTSMDILCSQYPQADKKNMIEAIIPAMNNDKGKVVLLSPSGTILDQVEYTEQMHHSLLQNYEGVSLERISVNSPSNEPENWHSASESYGFATPGSSNSQAKQIFNSSQQWHINPIAFNPYGNTFQDFTLIEYSLPQSKQSMVSIRIFDAQGRIIKDLVQNTNIASKGFFKWDGTNQDGKLVSCGQYVIWVQMHESDRGKEDNFKLQVVVNSL
jgi:hypothetical protein